MSSVLRWLQSAGLAHFFPNFQERGVTEREFVELTLQDFASFGVTSTSDRQRLHKLVQVVRRELDGGSSRGKSAAYDRAQAGVTPSSHPEGYADKIRVAVRKRPRNRKEKAQGEMDVVTVLGQDRTIVVHEPKQKVDLTKYVESHKFQFDEVFGENEDNATIYRRTCRPLVDFCFNKGKATCFAYGQTGSGKTYTMMGPEGGQGKQAGMYVLAAQDIFSLMATRAYKHLTVWVSFFEIYGGKLFDLLNARQKLVCREDASKAVNIVGLRERKCDSVSDLLTLIGYGNSVRSTGQTGANIDSSRSHAILQIVLKKTTKKNRPAELHGKFSFIDLAGSERAADTSNNDRRTRLEGAEINKSLLALKECIRALDQSKKHQPFRGSKLTQVLKDSLIGNSRTVMIANISPSSGSCEHTLNTLRYSDRVKEMKSSGSKRKPRHDAYMPHYNSGVATPHITSVEDARRAVEGSSDSEEDVLTRTHQDLAANILVEEEDLVESHRSHIDAVMALASEELALLKSFDAESYNIDEYVAKLDKILARKNESTVALRSRLALFKTHLREEERLSNSFTRQ